MDDILKESNQRLVLNLIRIHKQLSGAELARITGLQPSTIVYILRILADKNLIFTGGVGPSTHRGGKRPTLWEVAPSNLFIIGMEILPKHIRIILSSINSNIIFQNKISIPQGISENNIFETISKTFHETLQVQKIKKGNLIGLGVAIPGMIDKESGKVLYSSSLNLEDFSFSKPLEEIVEIPVFLGNDANAGALGIQWFPENGGEKYNNKVFIMYNQEAKNLGYGIIIQNSLYQGTTGTAGEIFTPLPSIDKLVDEARQAITNENILLAKEDGVNGYDLLKVSELEKKGCPISSYVISKIYGYISEEITKTIGFLNPDIIVLGGDLPDIEKSITEKILPSVESEMLSKLHMGYLIPEIKSSAYKQFAVAMGANALVLSAWLNLER